MSNDDRTPTDGVPYYCMTCGEGFDEYMACERPDCLLEEKEMALKRVKSSRDSV